MRWLLLSPYLPHPAVGHGGGRATFDLARHAANAHELCVLCFRRPGESGLESALVDAGARVECVDLPAGGGPATWLDRAGGALRALAQDEPFLVQKYRRAAFHRRAVELVDELRPHAVQVEYMLLAHAARAAHAHATGPGAPSLEGECALGRPTVLLNSHEAGLLPRLRRAVDQPDRVTRWGRSLDAVRWARHERAALDWADVTLCVTPRDRELLEALGGSSLKTTMPLGADLAGLAPAEPGREGPPRLLFVGSFTHPPNVDAALVLARDIVPRLRERHPDLVCDIVGRQPPARLEQAAGAGVVLHGFVDDLDAAYARAQVVVAPLFSGGGIKIKVLEALGRGAALVTTPIGVEGIDVEDGVHASIAADPAAFAAATLGLLGDPATRQRLGAAGRERMRERYDWPSIVARIARGVLEGRWA